MQNTEDSVSRRGAVGNMSPELQHSYSVLRRLPLFEGIPSEELFQLIASGGVSHRPVRRDAFVADPHSATPAGGHLYVVLHGQVAVGVFDPQEFAERREAQRQFDVMSEAERKDQSALAPPPLARVAKKNLAAFVEGDLFNSTALPRESGFTVALYSVAPTEVAAIALSTVGDMVLRYPFFEARVRRAVETSRERLHNINGVKQEVLDFFIRQGLSVSGEMVRVRQLDLCIDCKQCEDACEERYGARRLTLGGYQLGMLDFIYTCRTCTDQRCIDPCDYDSIKYDETKGEVVINEASCVGCTLCAQLCPYGAIEMVDVEDPSNPTYRKEFKARLDADNKLDFGGGKPRVARARRIANKCDHCGDYGDQACVSACPTGSLIEVNAYDLFRERSEVATAVARAGYDRDVPRNRLELLPTKPFIDGANVHDAGIARVKRGRVNAGLIWGLGLGAFFLCVVEVVLRLYMPTASLKYLLLREQGLEPTLAAFQVTESGFTAGNELSVWCGYVGTVLMAIAAIYPMWRRMSGFRAIASNKVWFEFHLMTGTVGPLFIVLHSAFKLDNWVASAFWSMIIVAISGAVGRYLYTQMPELLNGRALEEVDHRKAFSNFRLKYPQAVKTAEDEIARHRRRAHDVSQNAGLWRSLLWIMGEDLKRPSRKFFRKIALREQAPRRVAKELGARTARLILIERRQVLLPRAQLVLHSWKKVHVPFTVILTVLSAVHIWQSWNVR